MGAKNPIILAALILSLSLALGCSGVGEPINEQQSQASSNQNGNPEPEPEPEDTTSPAVTVQSPDEGTTVSVPNITITGTCESDLLTEASGEGLAAPVTEPCENGEYSITAVLSSGNGRKDYLVTQIDAAGNEGQASSYVLRDTEGPEVSITSPAPGTRAMNGVELQGDCEGNEPVRLSGTGHASPDQTVCFNSRFNVNVIFSSGEGNKNIVVSQQDAFGNLGQDARTFIKDSTAPDVMITSPAPGTQAEMGVTLDGTCESGYPVSIDGPGAAQASETSCVNSSFSQYVEFSQGLGTKTIEVAQTDDVGNTGRDQRDFEKVEPDPGGGGGVVEYDGPTIYDELDQVTTPGQITNQQNALHPQEFIEDKPTINNIGFRWILEGDDNNNAQARVYYKKSSETDWRRGLNMLRHHNERAGVGSKSFVTGNLFAGSVLNLESDQEYDVRVELVDPDGIEGNASHEFTVSTQAPPAKIQGNTVHNVSAGSSVSQIYSKIREADPGDVVYLESGDYDLSGVINVQSAVQGKLTTRNNPIVIRGAGLGQTRLDFGSASSGGFYVSRTDHIHIEDMSIIDADVAVEAQGAVGLVVRNTRMDYVELGIQSYVQFLGNGETDWYISDNEIIGRKPDWKPYRDVSGPRADAGIMLYGKNHVIRNNYITRFWDGITINDSNATNFQDEVDPANPPCMNIDIHGNDITETEDDSIEMDYCFQNVRVYNNRLANTHSGISAQPFYGGPGYIFRNTIVNVAVDNPLKFHNEPKGLEVYHNTFLSHDQAWQITGGWGNARIFNNLFMGSESISAPSVATQMASHPLNRMDYNGYTESRGDLFAWDRYYSTIQSFFNGTGFEEHGQTVSYGVFLDAQHVAGEGRTYGLNEMDLRLVPSAQDQGIYVPNISGPVDGDAPDWGAFEGP